MPLICYVERNFSTASLALIGEANDIIAEYSQQGFDLTLRQLYYQFVSRDLIANKQTEYKRLGSVVNDARLAGLIDWDTIVDRTRRLESLAHWDDPSEIVEASAKQFRIDKWAKQPVRVEVWIEKDALVGVIEKVCKELDVPYFSCRGYTSQSEMWSAARRLIEYSEENDDEEGDEPKETHIIHLGDHDPSGIDMTRDIRDRLSLFMSHEGYDCEVTRIALNMNQVQQYNPPPNPAKITDSRAPVYIQKFGHNSWELDALEPRVLSDLIRSQIVGLQDADKWEEAEAEQQEGRDRLREVSESMRQEDAG